VGDLTVVPLDIADGPLGNDGEAGIGENFQYGRVRRVKRDLERAVVDDLDSQGVGDDTTALVVRFVLDTEPVRRLRDEVRSFAVLGLGESAERVF